MPLPPQRRRSYSDPKPLQSQQLHQPFYAMPQFTSPQLLPIPLTPAYVAYNGWPYPSPPLNWAVDKVDQLPPSPKKGEPRQYAMHMLMVPLTQVEQRPRLLYDVRFSKSKAYLAQGNQPAVRLRDEYYEHLATNPRVPKMRLISKHLLPWPIVVKNPTGVTIGDIIEAIHTELDKPLSESEYWIAPQSDRDRVVKTFKHNCSDAPGVTGKRKEQDGVKRVDWLGSRTMFKGITRHSRDHPFITERFTDKKVQAETWILELDHS